MSDRLNSPGGGAPALPHGFAVRCLPAADGSGLWQDISALGDGRFGVSMGRCVDAGRIGLIRSEAGRILRATGNPALALDGLSDDVPAAICLVIDNADSSLCFSGIGDGVAVVAEPDGSEHILEPADGTLVHSALRPGATVLAHTAGESCRTALPSDGAIAYPGEVLEEVVGRLDASVERDGVAVLVYRRPPNPLVITVPAEPASLAVVRGQLRRWLALASVDTEVTADTLLAVGEAASNSTEHAVLGAEHTVELTVRASISQGRLHFEVSDNGRWRPPPECSGHRGHGIRLMKALVDTADLTPTDRGTTVEMFKELPQ